MTTDNELTYALELTGQPVRLSVTIVYGPAESSSRPHCGHFDFSAPCRGRGCWGRGRGREAWKEEREKLSPLERLNMKIKHVESLLETADLPVNRQRCLNWRLEKLNAKLEEVKEKQILVAEAASNTPCEPVSEITTEQRSENIHCFRGWGGAHGRPHGRLHGGPHGDPHGGHRARGAGCPRAFGPPGGSHCARGPCSKAKASVETVPCDREQIWENFHTCRVNLNAARDSGNQEQIEKCLQALREAKEKKREAKGMKRIGKKCLFWEEKAAKCACLKNLREARLSGNPEKIKQCEEALTVARQTLNASKIDYCLNKQ